MRSRLQRNFEAHVCGEISVKTKAAKAHKLTREGQWVAGRALDDLGQLQSVGT